MNWTGGRLQRHSAALNSAQQLQKQHFARVAKQNRPNGSKFKSPVKWPVFDLIAEDREWGVREISTSQHYPTASSREQNGQFTKHSNQSIPNPHGAGKREVRKSNKSLTAQVNRHVAKTQDRARPSLITDDDLYNATPPPRNFKQQREESVSLSEIEIFVEHEEAEETEEESTSEKRRRILRRGDWVGVAIQKPLQLAFASPRDEENIGRRRKVPHGSHRARYESRQTHITSPFPPKSRPPATILPSSWSRQQQQLEVGKADVRISIGGKIVPPGLSSSSAPRASGHRGSQATPSDVMLLDHDDPFQDREPGLSRSVAQHYSQLSRSHNQDTQQPSPFARRHFQSEEIGDDHRVGNQDEGFEYRANIFPDLNYEQREDNHSIYGDPAYDEGPQDPSKAPVPEGATPSLQPYSDHQARQVVFSSSSTSIHHPKPQSSRVSVLIRSGSSDNVQSTVAQVGKRKPAVPSSQIDENEIWESWIAPLYQVSPSQNTRNLANNGDRLQVNISPGISAWGQMVEANNSCYDGESSDPEGSMTGHSVRETSSEQLERQSSICANMPRNSEYQYSQQQNESMSNAETETYPCHRKPPVAIWVPAATTNIIRENTDEMWRKFVFGSSSDDLEGHPPGKVDPQLPAGSSMLGNPASLESVDYAWNTKSWEGQTLAHTSNISMGVSNNRSIRKQRMPSYPAASGSEL